MGARTAVLGIISRRYKRIVQIEPRTLQKKAKEAMAKRRNRGDEPWGENTH